MKHFYFEGERTERSEAKRLLLALWELYTVNPSCCTGFDIKLGRVAGSKSERRVGKKE